MILVTVKNGVTVLERSLEFLVKWSPDPLSLQGSRANCKPGVGAVLSHNFIACHSDTIFFF